MRRRIGGGDAKKRGSRGKGQERQYPTLAQYFDAWRGNDKGANVYGGRQEVAVAPASPLAAVAATAGQIITMDPSAGGFLTNMTLQTDASVGDIEVEGLSHNNVPLLVRSVPAELFAPDSRVNPLIGRVAIRSDSLFVTIKNNNVAIKDVYVCIGQEPWLGSRPSGTKGRSMHPAIAGDQENSIIAVGSNEGRTSIAAGATQVFSFKANEPCVLKQFVIVTDVALGDLQVTAFAIDNRNQIDGGSIPGAMFGTTGTTVPLFESFVEPADVITVSIKNNNAGAQIVQPCFTTASLRRAA